MRNDKLNRESLEKAIGNLFATFVHYRIGDDFTGCDCCVSREESAKLAASKIRDLQYDDLERYSRKALTTWGDVRHFKHFLPRLLELTIEHRDEFLDLAVVFGRLSYGHWETWPQRESDAVAKFLDEYWRYQLADPIVGTFQDSIDTVLCAIGNAVSSVQPFLDTWIKTDTDNAKRHLAAFILQNDDALIMKGRLWNSFWDVSGQPHRQVVNWLRSENVVGYLRSASDTVLIDDFSYALPQLMAIRSALAETAD